MEYVRYYCDNCPPSDKNYDYCTSDIKIIKNIINSSYIVVFDSLHWCEECVINFRNLILQLQLNETVLQQIYTECIMITNINYTVEYGKFDIYFKHNGICIYESKFKHIRTNINKKEFLSKIKPGSILDIYNCTFADIEQMLSIGNFTISKKCIRLENNLYNELYFVNSPITTKSAVH